MTRGVVSVPIFDGLVNVDGENVHVVLALEEETVRLSAQGTEIGEWPVAECSIDHMGEGVYTITANNESLRFVPNDPGLFALRLNGTRPSIAEIPEVMYEEEPPVAAAEPEAPLPNG